MPDTRVRDRAQVVPSAYQGSGDDKGNDQASSLPERIARYSRAKDRAVAMAGYLDTLPADDARRARVALKDCGNYLHFRHYFTVGEVRLHSARFCKQHLICPLCAIRRGARTLAAYLARFHIIQAQRPDLRPYLITLTVLNGDNLLERFGHLKRSLKVLQQRRHRWLSGSRDAPWTEFAKIEAAVGSFEVTNKGKGWHPHVHILALAASAPDQQALRDEWQGITGDSFMLDVRPFHDNQDPADGFMEVMKYAVKFGDLSLEQNWQVAQFLKGRRLLFSLGLFRGVQVPESLLDEPLDDLPFFDLFYRYFLESGYVMQDTL